MDKPEGVPEGSQPVVLINSDGTELTTLWVGPNHDKLGLLIFNPEGVKRLTVEGRPKKGE